MPWDFALSCQDRVTFSVNNKRITFIWWRFTGKLLPDHDLTPRTKDLTPRSLQQLTTCPSIFAFKGAC